MNPRKALSMAISTGIISLVLVGLLGTAYLREHNVSLALRTMGGCRTDGDIAPLQSLDRVDLPPEPKINNGRDAGSILKHDCASQEKGYHILTCPVWYDEANPPSALDPISRERGIDYRVRYLHRLQNPDGDCLDQNYYTKGVRDTSIFNAFKLFLSRGLYAAALSGRIFVLPDGNTFEYADEKRYDAIFEPLSKCSGVDAATLERMGEPSVALKEVTPDPAILLDTSIRVVDDVSIDGIAYQQVFKQGERPPFPNLMQFGEDPDDIHAGLLLYSMRLRPSSRAKVEHMLADSLPCDFEPARSISLPIRGSDKCRGPMHTGYNDGESDCLEFDAYMQAAELIRANDPRVRRAKSCFEKGTGGSSLDEVNGRPYSPKDHPHTLPTLYTNRQVDTIILTSEDERYLDPAHRARHSSRWRFVVNKHDIMPSTGLGHSRLKEIAQERNASMDGILLSALTSLQLQMRGKYFVLNCDSGVHMTIAKLARNGGCSLAPNPRIFCLQHQVGEINMCKMFDAECFKRKYDVSIKSL